MIVHINGFSPQNFFSLVGAHRPPAGIFSRFPRSSFSCGLFFAIQMQLEGSPTKIAPSACPDSTQPQAPLFSFFHIFPFPTSRVPQCKSPSFFPLCEVLFFTCPLEEGNFFFCLRVLRGFFSHPTNVDPPPLKSILLRSEPLRPLHNDFSPHVVFGVA